MAWCWSGPQDGADAALAEARAQEGLLMDGVGPAPVLGAARPVGVPGLHDDEPQPEDRERERGERSVEIAQHGL